MRNGNRRTYRGRPMELSRQRGCHCIARKLKFGREEIGEKGPERCRIEELVGAEIDARQG